MRGFINRSRRRFIPQAGLGLLAYVGLPGGWLRAMEGMAGMLKGRPTRPTPISTRTWNSN